ncbi:MAG: hypothetical protein ACTSYS_13785 [Promethearchaeota archaeon]
MTKMINNNHMNNKWQVNIAELHVPPLAPIWANVGPKHPKWQERLKLEVLLLKKYITFLRSEGSKPWFYLVIDKNPQFRGMLWRGYIQIPSRPDIKFNIVILLSSEYPKIMPRCFVEESISNYCGKLYLNNKWKDPITSRSFIMICHDHMKEISRIWEPVLSIAHFFIREVWFWFAAMQNIIIQEWDKKHQNQS